MSRLQAGGLSLVIGYETSTRNIYKTVICEQYLGIVEFDDGSKWEDCWMVSGENLVDSAYCSIDFCYTRAAFLMPINENKTRDELAKEKELEYSK